MPTMSQTILRFVMKSSENPMDIMNRFNPQGKPVLNRTEWRGKEPRSCGVTNVSIRPHSVGSHEPFIVDVEVTNRPQGCIVYVGKTKYDGWTAMMLDRKNDGTLLDGHGKPLPEGQPPVYLRFELFDDVDFNEIDFGEFVNEFAVEDVKHVEYDDVLQNCSSISSSSTFMAPRRHRPQVKIILSNSPSGTMTDGFGTKIINVSNFTPHLQQVLLDELGELVSGFIEGRYSIKNLSNNDFVFADLSDSLVDCTPNEEGKESRFGCLTEYVPATLLEDLAKRLMATYEIEVSVVDGRRTGLLLRKLAPSKRG